MTREEIEANACGSAEGNVILHRHARCIRDLDARLREHDATIDELRRQVEQLRAIVVGRDQKRVASAPAGTR